jgi:hypothetical protein
MKILKNEDFLRAAFNADDAVSLCEHISRRYGHELTLKQAGRLIETAENICEDCLGDEFDAEGYCVSCSEPGSGSR